MAPPRFPTAWLRVNFALPLIVPLLVTLIAPPACCELLLSKTPPVIDTVLAEIAPPEPLPPPAELPEKLTLLVVTLPARTPAPSPETPVVAPFSMVRFWRLSVGLAPVWSMTRTEPTPSLPL